ncbi:MAG: L-fucose:H+ symporter permease [Bacteroidales bacterium]|nr:L-fucose:H+ symporter permease [Bacteroidales bacterium]
MTQNLQSKLVEKKYLLTFILITSLFALWGFANDITNPMVAAFQTVMELSAAKASLVQFAFYGGYATMAIPAALFARRYSYKKGILLGLILYAIGAFMFIPAANRQEFGFFCVSLYVLTFGLAFLETTANPYILSLGSKETSTRRLNLAQAFNPIGSLMGMFVASRIVLAKLESDTAAVREVGFSNLDEMTKLSIREHDLDIIRNPYVALGCVVLFVFVIIAIFVKNQNNEARETTSNNKGTLKRLFSNKVYREGVVTQLFYVAAQIMTWTFIIQYADRLGIDKATAQLYNIIAMGMFLCGRFISTFLMKYVNSRKLLMFFAIGAMLASAGTILIDGVMGLYCLMAISIFMSLMFPTIYGIALENVSLEDSSLGAAFLVMAIVGGALMPPLQGMIIDLGTVGSLPAVNFSFILPFICFVVIFIYGLRTSRMK